MGCRVALPQRLALKPCPCPAYPPRLSLLAPISCPAPATSPARPHGTRPPLPAREGKPGDGTPPPPYLNMTSLEIFIKNPPTPKILRVTYYRKDPYVVKIRNFVESYYKNLGESWDSGNCVVSSSRTLNLPNCSFWKSKFAVLQKKSASSPEREVCQPFLVFPKIAEKVTYGVYYVYIDIYCLT